MATGKTGADDFASDEIAKPTVEDGNVTLPSDFAATLVRLEGLDETSVHPILIDTFLIGRAEESDLRISRDKKVSRLHARIVRRAFQYIIEDMKSANGVLINGERLEAPTELRDGDRVQIGNHVYIFCRNRPI